MPNKVDWYFHRTGKKREDLSKARLTTTQVSQKRISQLKSEHPLVSLGVKSTGGKLFISEEERGVNFHVLGGSGEGKSKFLEHLIRHDIDKGNALCLIDPSDYGATSESILRYCALKDIKNVVYITPDSLLKYGKIAAIQPLQGRYMNQSVDSILEVVNILFGNERQETPRIRTRLSAILRSLARKNATLYETQYFRLFNDFKNIYQYDLLTGDNDSKAILQDYRTANTFENFMSSTINRLNSFWQEPLSLMFAAATGIDFVKMIRDKWIIIVNIAPSDQLNPEQSQLLGVMVISQLSRAIDILKSNTQSNRWKGIYYLYIDEAGRFSTPQIEQILDYKRKSGLRLVFAHHYFEQFDNRKVLNAMKQNTGVKVMFNTREPEDRLQMMKSLGYGGDIPPEMAAYANKDLPKQYAIIKKNKEAPVRVRIPDTPDVQIDNKTLDTYVEFLLQQDWYLTEKQIIDQINARINREKTQGQNTVRTGTAKVPNYKTTDKTDSTERPESVGDGQKERPKTPKKEPIKF